MPDVMDKGDKDEAKRRLETIQGPVHLHLERPLIGQIQVASKKIPLVSGVLRDSTLSGRSIAQISRTVNIINRAQVHGAASRAWTMAGLGFAVVDFLAVPLIYLGAWILNEKVPFNLTNNARWAYAAAALALTITSVLVPVAAPVIAFFLAGSSLVLSTGLLGRSLYERYQLARESRSVQRQIVQCEKELEQTQQEARDLHGYFESTEALEKQISVQKAVLHALEERVQSSVVSEEDLQEFELLKEKLRISEALLAAEENELKSHAIQVEVLQEAFNSQKERLMDLKEKELVINEKIKEVGLMHVVDRTLMVGFAAVGLAGLVLALIIPPVGIGLLIGVSVISLTYVAARMTAVVLQSSDKKSSSMSDENALNEDTEVVLDNSPSNHPAPDEPSTAFMLRQLSPSGSGSKKEKPVLEEEILFQPQIPAPPDPPAAPEDLPTCGPKKSG